MSAIPILSFSDMLKISQPGDYLFLWDKTPISYIIEDITAAVINGQKEAGPSHVMTLTSLTEDSSQLYEFEATFIFGCRLLPISHYASKKNRMLLCRRNEATAEDIQKVVAIAAGCLGEQYEVLEEIEIALQKVAPWLPVRKTDNKLYCSGYLEYEFSTGNVPFSPSKTGGNITPMEGMMDEKTNYLCWVN